MENQFPPFAFSVSRILDSAFWVEEALDAEPEKDVKIGYGLEFFSNAKESWAQYNISAQFSIQENVFATGTVVTKFSIINLAAFVDTSDDKIIWPGNALETMFGIAFSHTRALLAKNMAGTKFSKYIVPLVNPSELFKQLITNNPNFQAEIVNSAGETL